MMSPFFPNGIVCLIAFESDRAIGWWLTLFVEILWLTCWAALAWPIVSRWHANRRLLRASLRATT